MLHVAVVYSIMTFDWYIFLVVHDERRNVWLVWHQFLELRKCSWCYEFKVINWFLGLKFSCQVGILHILSTRWNSWVCFFNNSISRFLFLFNSFEWKFNWSFAFVGTGWSSFGWFSFLLSFVDWHNIIWFFLHSWWTKRGLFANNILFGFLSEASLLAHESIFGTYVLHLGVLEVNIVFIDVMF